MKHTAAAGKWAASLDAADRRRLEDSLTALALIELGYARTDENADDRRRPPADLLKDSIRGGVPHTEFGRDLEARLLVEARKEAIKRLEHRKTISIEINASELIKIVHEQLGIDAGRGR